MNGRCTGLCLKYKFKSITPRLSKYEQGASRCNNACEVFIKWDGIFCPCCSIRLRKSCKSKHQAERRLQKKLLNNIPVFRL
jgi:hypothetical protein